MKYHFARVPAWLLFGWTIFALLTSASAQTTRPNIVFFQTEDAGAFDSVIGTPGVQTPGLESIASRGVYFSIAHVAAPVCSVSKGAFMTGLMPHSNKLRTNVFNYFPGASGIGAGGIAQGDTSGRLAQMIAGGSGQLSQLAVSDS